MSEFKRIRVHVNLVRQLRNLKELRRFRNMTIEEITAFVKVIPFDNEEIKLKKFLKKIGKEIFP